MAPRPAAGDPQERIAAFARLLREHGFAIGLAELGLMLRIAAELPPARWQQLEALWRSAVATDRRRWALFPELFARFWFPQRGGALRRIGAQPRRGASLPQLVAALQGQAAPGGEGGSPPAWAGEGEEEEAGAPRASGGASRVEALAERPFDDWRAGDLQRLEPVIADFVRRLRRRLLRRWTAAAQGPALHLRRSLHAACATGGELVVLRHRRRRRQRPRVAVLVDVSRSMERHAPLYLRVARVFAELAGARVFVFHTRLAEVTPMLLGRGPQPGQRLEAASLGLGGGTRIAACLAQAWAGPLRAGLGRGDYALVCSDGYDTDPPAQLAGIAGRIAARGVGLLWLHPTRAPPASLALQAAAGAVRAFVPAYDLASLARLPLYL